MNSFFEFFSTRAEHIDQDKFVAYLEDPECKELFDAVKKEMMFDNDSNNSNVDDELVTLQFGSNFDESIKKLQEWFDKKSIRVTTGALVLAIAYTLDPDGTKEYSELVPRDLDGNPISPEN